MLHASCILRRGLLLAVATAAVTVHAADPEDVQVFAQVVSGRSIRAAKSCVMTAGLPYLPTVSQDTHSIVHSFEAQPFQLLDELMFNSEFAGESESFQSLFACLIQRGRIRASINSSAVATPLWGQIFRSAGIFSSNRLRELAIAVGKALPTSLGWTNAWGTDGVPDRFNLLHASIGTQHVLLDDIVASLRAAALPPAFVLRMVRAGTILASDSHLPPSLLTSSSEALDRLLHKRQQSGLLGVTFALQDTQTLRHALKWTSLSFFVAAVNAHDAAVLNRTGTHPVPATLRGLMLGRDLLGRTPLHVAVELNNSDIIQTLGDTLLCAGCEMAVASDVVGVLALANSFGYTPLQMAHASGKSAAEGALRAAIFAVGASQDTCVSCHRAGGAPVGVFPVIAPVNSLNQADANFTTHVNSPVFELADVVTTLFRVGSPPISKHRQSATHADDGGWVQVLNLPPTSRAAIAHVLQHGTTGCEVDVAHPNITALEFFSQYWLPRRPVLLRGGAAGWDADGLWQQTTFLRRHGGDSCRVGVHPHSPYAEGRTMSIAEFVRRLHECTPESKEVWCEAFVRDISPYTFDIVQADRDLARELTRLPLLNVGVHAFYAEASRTGSAMAPTQWGVSPDAQASVLEATKNTGIYRELPIFLREKPQLYVGGAGSGAAMHTHSDAYNVLMYGQKQWFLQPPALAEHSTVSIQDFIVHKLAHVPPHRAPLQCRQESGDILFVPQGWGHGTLNLRTTVGYGIEFASLLDRNYL